MIQADFPGGGSEVVDWDSPYFGRTFALYVFLGAGFQANYLFLYFVIENREYSSVEGCASLTVKSSVSLPTLSALLVFCAPQSLP